MSKHIESIDLDRLATFLSSEIREKQLSVRAAANEIGCSPATLTRLLKGAEAENVPDFVNLVKATSWLGKSVTDFERGKTPASSSLADVEVHLRALPGLTDRDAEAIVAMVKAAYDSAKRQTKKASSGR